MRHGSLFSGIGAAEIAAEMLGMENVFHCEINPFGRQILDYWFPNSASYEDITETDFSQYRGKIDILTGGFPCQPFSYAGKRGGQTDDRYLWHEMLRVIDEVRPMWVIGENVNGITTMVESYSVAEMGGESSLFCEGDRIHRFRSEQTFTIERICSDLESKGYSVQPMLVPACSVGAPHRRDRIFILAYNVADSDCGNDMRESGEYEGKSREEWLSKRNEIRKPGESDNVRSEMQESASYSDSKRLEDRFSSRFREDSEKERARVENRTERPCNNGDVADTNCKRPQRRHYCNKEGHRETKSGSVGFIHCDKMLPGNRWEGFPSVSPVHRGNDGLPFDVGNLTISFSKWRTESIKAYGNAIVPQVLYQIMKCIQDITYNH